MDLDYYSLEYFKNKIKNLSFLEVQRLAYPIINLSKQSQLSSIILDEFYLRVESEQRSVNEVSIDTLLKSIKNNEKILKNFTEDDLKYLITIIESVVYYGKTTRNIDKKMVNYFGVSVECDSYMENGEPYIHYEYDKSLNELVYFFKKELNKQMCSNYLKKYGIDNFEDMNHDDIEKLITSMASIGNINNYNYEFNLDVIKHTMYSKVFNGLYEILDDMNNYKIPFEVSDINLKNLDCKKIRTVQNILYLSIKFSAGQDEFITLLNNMNEEPGEISKEEIEIALSICHNNSYNDIETSIENIKQELINRNMNTYSNKYLEIANKMFHDLIKEIKVKTLKR